MHHLVKSIISWMVFVNLSRLGDCFTSRISLANVGSSLSKSKKTKKIQLQSFPDRL